ncbi:MAG: hypothetical protein ACREMR_03595 [Gemmatimonadales bacterium]
MSTPSVARAIAQLREATADAAWAQWSAIFTLAASRRPARSIVDPESLLLISLALRDHEPRLWSAAVLWAQFGVRLLSVQRAKNLALRFPAAVRERLAEFAQLAMADGGDQRWRSLASHTALRTKRKGPARTAAPRLEGGAALMLRLRLGLGVGIKPDVLACLIGHAGGAMPVVLIARATAYQGRAVRRALEQLVASGFIESRPTTPVSYRVDNAKWAGLLEFVSKEPPAWRAWAGTYAFIAALDEWSRSLPQSELVLASEARDRVAEYGQGLDPAVRVPMLDKYHGMAYVGPFVKAIEGCREFLELVV